MRCLIASIGAILLSACSSSSPISPNPAVSGFQPYVQIQHPDWAKDAVIYQMNIRQFSAEGTIKAAEQQLPRLADMGVDIIWLMPIHPIGEKNRKGTLGSPYSVKDFRAVNPEFGTLKDLKSFIESAHELGLYVILDWVANHTAWDNHLVVEHPEWYERDWDGDFMPTRWWDWSDIIDLDYSNLELRDYMVDAMRYWVQDVGVDGFRCDVAGYIPLDFWERARAELDAIKPVFMLGEFDQRDIHARAFDASYAWGWKNVMQAVARGDNDATGFYGYYSGNESVWPHDAYRMVYTSNHDQNSWDEAAPVLYGDAYENAIILSFIGEGIPLIYNGQEARNEDMLAFFEKDPIEWRKHPIEDLFRKLIQLKTETTALHNGATGARMIPVVNTAPKQVLSFSRMDKNGGVLALFNMSDTQAAFNFTDGPFAGDFVDAFSGKQISLDNSSSLKLKPWDRLVLLKSPGEK